jgi:hypothetical protein
LADFRNGSPPLRPAAGDVVSKLNSALVGALADGAVRARLADLG